MAKSIIRFLLTHADAQAEDILEAMESGALNIDADVRADPSLAADFLERQGTIYRKEYETLPPMAHRKAQCKLLQHMIDLGASPWHEYASGAPYPIRSAIATANPELVRMLTAHPDCPSDLIASMLQTMPDSVFNNRFPEILQVLFDAGLNPLVRQKSAISTQFQKSPGNTLLHEADNAAMAKFLLDVGLDPAAVNDAGQDVPACWDTRTGGTIAERQSLDEVLAAHAPVDKAALIAGLGDQWLTVGSTVCKARIKSALSVEPSSIIHDGFTLPEMILARLMDQELKHNGEEVKHRKMRRTLLSALAYCGITTPAQVVPGSGLHTAMGMFRQADLGLAASPSQYVRTTGGKLALRPTSDSSKKDTTGNVINDLLHLQPGAGISVDPDLSIAWIERATSAGLLKQSGQVALWHLRFNSQLHLRNPSANKTAPLARTLVCIARDQLTAGWSSYNPTSRLAMEMVHRWMEPSGGAALLEQPQALPAILLLFAGAGRLSPSSLNDRTLAALRMAVDNHIQAPGTTIDPDDELMVQAVAALNASPVEANTALGIRLDSSIQSSLMHVRTEPAPVTVQSGPRF